MKRWNKVLALALAAGLTTYTAQAQLPRLVSYQGVLTNAVGQPLPNGDYTLLITIYDAETGGNSVYTETQTANVTNGLFSTYIGKVSPFPANMDLTKDLYLEVAIQGQQPFSPRTLMSPAPQALYAETAKTAMALDPSAGGVVRTLNGIQGDLKVAGEGGVTVRVSNDTVYVSSAVLTQVITRVTSIDNTIAVTNPTGPTVDVSLADGAVTTNKIANGAVITEKIANGSITVDKLAPGLVPAAPSGPASGDLTGTYPAPSIAPGAVTTGKIADANVTTIKLADGAVTANKLSNGSVTTEKILDGTITLADIAPGVIPTSLPPSGAAGGDLTGTYPNPLVRNGAISTDKILDGAVTENKILTNAVTTDKIFDGAITSAKIQNGTIQAIDIAPGVIPTSLPPSGPAGGDLNGTYPNPTLRNTSVTTAALQDGSVTNIKLGASAVTTDKILDGTILLADMAPGVIPTTLPPSGTAGGDLTGTYPNPTIRANGVTTLTITDGAVTNGKLAPNAVTTDKILDGTILLADMAPGVIPTSLPPNGTAGGDLTGTYPNPTLRNTSVTTAALADGSVINAKLAPNAVTTDKIMDGTILLADMAPGVIPTTLPPSGVAGGDLNGTYPNPTIRANSVITTTIADGAVINQKLGNNAVTTDKIQDGTIIAADIAPGVIPTTLPPTGPAGGVLSGSYPNPGFATNAGNAMLSILNNGSTVGTLSDARLNQTAVVPGTYGNVLNVPTFTVDNWGRITNATQTALPTSYPPTGAAGGDLTGTYPNPTIKTDAITTAKILDANVTNPKLAPDAVTTDKILNGTILAADIAPGVIPTTLPPTGPAGGHLTGTYPNPLLATTASAGDAMVTALSTAYMNGNVQINTANNIVVIDNANQLPAVNGTFLQNLNASNITAGVLAIARGGTNSTTALQNNRVMISAGGSIIESGPLTTGSFIIGNGAPNQPSIGTILAGPGASVNYSAPNFTIGVINPMPTGTVNNSTARWDTGLGLWVENTNVLATASGDVSMAGNLDVNGSATIGTLNGVVKATSGVLSAGLVNLVTEVTNILQPLHGGTGLNGSTAANGTLLIGNGAGYTLANLTPGFAISITNGPGSITISSLSAMVQPGTADDNTLRWDNTAMEWVENTNVTSTAAGVLTANTSVNSPVGNLTTVNATDVFSTNGTIDNLTSTTATITTGNITTVNATDVNTTNANVTTNLTIGALNGPLRATAGLVSAGPIDLTSEVTGILPIANGGTNTSTVPLDGQLLIGNGTDYTVANITGGTGITITNGPGSIDVAFNGLLLPTGTLDNSTLRWDNTAMEWVENTNVLADASGNMNVASLTTTADVTIGGNVTVTGNSTINGTARNAAGVTYALGMVPSPTYNISILDHVLVFNGATAQTATLPAANVEPGIVYVFKNVNANVGETVSISAQPGETIDGAMMPQVLAGSGNFTIKLISNGVTGWYVIQ